MSSNQDATLSQRIDVLIAECRRRGAGPTVEEVESLYTDGCAAVLVLEAEHLRVERRLAVDPVGQWDDARSAAEARVLSERLERVAGELGEVRSHLRQLRAALEWAQSGADVQQRIGFAWRTDDNGRHRP